MELTLLKDIVVIFALSVFVNLLFTRLRIPTVVGYLLTGVIAGPHLLSIVSSKHEIELLAEVGVVSLLFTIGMEFSLKHLMKIRRIVFFGGAIQVLFTALIFYFASGLYGLDWKSGIFIGFLAALSSSALVLKLLQERSELTSNYGRTVLGILIFQDIMLVPLLLFTNLFGNGMANLGSELVLLVLKTLLIIGVVYAGNKWILPKVLFLIARTKSQEIFLMSIFLICLAIALLTSELGMSLAFGAFLAGLMISESEYSHNAFSNLVPFKDMFTSFFFVSIGMLLDLNFVIENMQLVALSVLLVLGVKTVIAGGTGFILGHTFRGTVMVGLALSQVGEFSFILAKIGLSLNILSDYFYQLFLAVAVITMSLTPFMIRGSRIIANMMLKLPLPKFWVEGLFPLQEIEIPEMKGHLVIIGKDTSALKLSRMAHHNNIRHISIVFDPMLSKEKMDKGDLVVYGDAVNEPILEKAHVDTADTVVVSVGSVIPSMAIIEKVRKLSPKTYIIARAPSVDNVESLYNTGADQVLAEKLEIAIDLFHRILIKNLYPAAEINSILNQMRSLNLGEHTNKDIANQLTVLEEFANNTIATVPIPANSTVIGKSIIDIQLRKHTGVTLLAIKRGEEMIEHPVPQTIFKENDVVYVLGNPEQVKMAKQLIIS